MDSVKTTSSLSYAGSFKRSIPMKQHQSLQHNVTIPTPKSPYRTTTNIHQHQNPLDSINVSRMSENNPSIEKQKTRSRAVTTEYGVPPKDTIPDINGICETRIENVKKAFLNKVSVTFKQR